MNTHSIARVQDFLPLLTEIGPVFSQRLMQQALCADPSLESVFDLDAVYSGRFTVDLNRIIVSYLTNIEDRANREFIIDTAAKYAPSQLVHPSQYGVIGHQLIETVKFFSGGELDQAGQDAWKDAFWAFANGIISRRAMDNKRQTTA